MLIPKENRIRDKKHLRWIASLPCCVTGRTDTQAAHIRTGCYSIGMKPRDSLVVPLSVKEHRRQHTMSESEYWKQWGGVDKAKQLASDLYAVSGDTQIAIELMARFRLGI